MTYDALTKTDLYMYWPLIQHCEKLVVYFADAVHAGGAAVKILHTKIPGKVKVAHKTWAVLGRFLRCPGFDRVAWWVFSRYLSLSPSLADVVIFM